MPPTRAASQPRILLSSVFGPFAQDDEYGSRAINPMELYHNQVTREQGPFSLRMFHRSWGITMIQRNISAPCTVLDFPTRERFIREIALHHYDIVGISGIIVNAGKVREMCRLVRRYSPRSTVVVGGHVAAIPGVEQMFDADHIVKGEGIEWFRRHLGEDPGRPIVHPVLPASFGFRIMGIRPPGGGSDEAATIIPSVGCPLGCNFCTTSSFFGGKGKAIHFFRTGAELYRVMCEAEATLGTSTFFLMDENFLLDRRRALELLDCVRRGGKSWALYCFSSANAIAKYDIRELVELGVAWIWLGLESADSRYKKLAGADTRALTAELQSHGIRVLGSTIIGLEHHTPENVGAEIEHAISHDTDFHQFMLYTPVPGTPLFREMEDAKRMLPAVDLADIHGQFKFNFRHEAISREQSKVLLDQAFRRDFERNGPSLYRLMRTALTGVRRYGKDHDPRIRARVALDRKQLGGTYGAALWAMERYFRPVNRPVSDRIRELQREMRREFGGVSRLITAVGGPALLWTSRREAARYPQGRRLEPPTFLEHSPGAVS